MLRVLFAGLLLMSTTALLAQERHLSDSAAQALYTRSAFAHGYMHGYERGFHSGDVDVQLGRQPRDPVTIHDFKHSTDGFFPSEGPKSMWKAGYRFGFLAGYGDAVHLLPFRAVDLLRKAADGIKKTAGPSEVFDKAFRDGYESGRGQGAQDALDAAAADPIVPPCMQLPGDSCDGFERGFHLGYADGYQNLLGKPKKSKIQVAAEE